MRKERPPSVRQSVNPLFSKTTFLFYSLFLFSAAMDTTAKLICPDCGRVVLKSLLFGHILTTHKRIPRPNECEDLIKIDDEVEIVYDKALHELVGQFVSNNKVVCFSKEEMARKFRVSFVEREGNKNK
jgi:hypothetical protein